MGQGGRGGEASEDRDRDRRRDRDRDRDRGRGRDRAAGFAERLLPVLWGYALNQETKLRRVLIDGDIPLDNTRAERALRKIVVGRKNWLFYGTDAHAEAAAAVFSILATCRLHAIDPFVYLDEVLRVLPFWPRDRYLELAPQHWLATRARLDAAELARPLSTISVPPPPTEALTAAAP